MGIKGGYNKPVMDEFVRALLPSDCAMVDGILSEDGESHQVGDFDVRVDHGAEWFQTSNPGKPCVIRACLKTSFIRNTSQFLSA